MTPIEHLQSVCPESAGWAVVAIRPDYAIAQRGVWTVKIVDIRDGWRCLVSGKVAGSHVVKNTHHADPIHAIIDACVAVVDELRELIQGAP